MSTEWVLVPGTSKQAIKLQYSSKEYYEWL